MTRNILTPILSILFLIPSSSLESKHAITHAKQTKFETNLFNYVQARFISYTTGTPFLYQKFNESDQLNLTYKAKPYEEKNSEYETEFHIDSLSAFNEFLRKIREPNTPPTIFVVKYLPGHLVTWNPNTIKGNILFCIPWHDIDFDTYIKKCIQFKKEVPIIAKENILNVALYIPDESKIDTEVDPLVYPNFSYYVNQIKRINKWNRSHPIHILLLSNRDGINQLAEKLKSACPETKLLFTTRKNITQSENFFILQQFQVLIATQSNFSLMAAQCGNFNAILIPVHYQDEPPSTWIDCVQIICKKSALINYDLDMIVRDYK